MKLQTALVLFIWGTNHSYGNAFASTQSTSLAFHKYSSPFITNRISRGGADPVAPSKSLSALSLSATIDDVDVPEKVAQYISADNWSLLSVRGKQALTNLITGDEGIGAQEHIFKDWPEAGVDDEGKVKLTEQVRMLFNA